MTESEKLQRTIAEFESEVAGLTADIADLERRLGLATITAEQRIAAAERRADDVTQVAAVDAEQERQRLATALNRKRLALAAAASDLQTARHGLTEAMKAARFIQLQSALDEIAAAAGAIDGAPMDPELWSALHDRVTVGQALFRECGGRQGDWVQSPQWARAQLFAAYATRIDWALGSRIEAPKEIPAMQGLLQLDRSGGLIKELMGT